MVTVSKEYLKYKGFIITKISDTEYKTSIDDSVHKSLGEAKFWTDYLLK